MKQFFELIPEQFLKAAEGCSEQAITELEQTLGISFPASLREYLTIFGKKQSHFPECHMHGCDDMLRIWEPLNYMRALWEDAGINTGFMDNIIFFFNFQDTYFYVPYEAGDDPAVYALDIGDEPTIRKLNDHLSTYIRYWMEQMLTGKYW
ncbi:SMI1/KNR4 family protein [Arsenicibacter rosenii]|uniref:Knr4/Smi1-like domain-containing protein n=1 Tax=Arsenicibacter rosenii TaxID=1750698 RepID=A0A1S2VNS3_9BACT|nr:SMI1/KNR4 family protein [Arsenicibacter rosenii]OIN60432.1 hypothetical protein BLX24_06325 [Arsenicibacter rosenii]